MRRGVHRLAVHGLPYAGGAGCTPSLRLPYAGWAGRTPLGLAVRRGCLPGSTASAGRTDQRRAAPNSQAAGPGSRGVRRAADALRCVREGQHKAPCGSARWAAIATRPSNFSFRSMQRLQRTLAVFLGSPPVTRCVSCWRPQSADEHHHDDVTRRPHDERDLDDRANLRSRTCTRQIRHHVDRGAEDLASVTSCWPRTTCHRQEEGPPSTKLTKESRRTVDAFERIFSISGLRA